MSTRLSTLSLALTQSDKSPFSLISKKIYNYDLTTLKAFIFSLLLHTSLFAMLFVWRPNITIEPIKEEPNVVALSLVAPPSVSVAPKTPTQRPAAIVEPIVEKRVAPKKRVTPKKVVAAKKRVVTKKVVPLKEAKPLKKVEPIKELAPLPKQPAQKEALQDTKTALPSEVSTSQPPKTAPLQAASTQKSTPTQREISSAESLSISSSTLGEIRSLIQNSLVYPAIARRMKIEGVVVVSFVLTQDGHVQSANILTPSGSRTLDKKALKTVLALSGEYPHLNKKVDLQIPISFSLKNS